MSIYGYIRVSSKDQNEDRQRIAMLEFGVPPNHIYADKLSGKNFNRPGYKQLLRRLKPDDILVLKSIDRLGRDYDEILEQWRIISKEKSAGIVVLDMPLLDTRQGRDLTGALIFDIVLQLLSYVAQTERENIHQRQAEGIAAARRRGVAFGRPPINVPPEFDHYAHRWAAGEVSACHAAKQLGLSPQTFLRRVRTPERNCTKK